MIGKQIKGKSFRGLLNYLFGKEGAKQIGGNMEGNNPRELAAEFRFSRQLNPKVSRAVYHASLSLPHQESLDDETWHEITQKYLQAMGFDMNQYTVVRHIDREHDHIHIVASRIRLDGTTVSDSWDYRRSEAVIRKLEQEYNLQSVQPSWEKDKHSPTTGERRQLARTGEESVRVRLQRSLDQATHDSPTMSELIEQIQQQGINVRVGYTRTGKVKGISYQLDGVALSGTHLGKAYTFPGLQKYRGVNYSPKRDDQRIQKLMEQFVENPTPAVPKQDDKRRKKLIEQTVENTASSVSVTNSLPIPEPANWEQIRLNLSQQYNLPNSLLTEVYEKGWLYASLAGQAIFVERTLNDVPTQAKQLEVTGNFTTIPLNSEMTKNGSFWMATDTTVKRAVLLSDPIEVLSVIALESAVDKGKRKPTLYWSVGDSEQLPLELLRSLDTVVIAFKDHEKVEGLIAEILAELPQAKQVSPGKAGWNKLLTDSKPQFTPSQIPEPQDYAL
ncbi:MULTISPECIES: relaxase/mobilization nuclease domain-containing protein [Calothrix]|uniref:Relaxase/mobilization nuclease domain-containing protein n=2 Tax=Calothrix TaxID=1186 RepID=A0ABR8AHG1_9CYAN|nr:MULTISPECIES: relaxase/mobilization nuclease domain-containing protein [Calothrix]MBD2199482.1 relaxase/mobilization nuclease domain-containing protein [Calothrix parietina FACHB-288]MBD2228138.1 relaxase/mobilization nuclease domain-containing protein [Calothrix anomala FACHB-343]